MLSPKSCPLNVLHIASFSGNIGDNINHMGFRPWFEAQLRREVKWNTQEIREFYWKERYWDRFFVDKANAHDLVIFGGGNYFELWVESSPTGTSIGIPADLFAKIRPPILFNALGVDAGQGVPSSALKKFRLFLDTLLGSDRNMVTVRNDGALSAVKLYLGDARAARLVRVPDAGFFCPTPSIKAPHKGRQRVAVNLACDMSKIRFASFGIGIEDGEDAFAQEIATVVDILADSMSLVDFVFIPHVFNDLKIIAKVLEKIRDRTRRTRVEVAPYGFGDSAASDLVSIYGGSDVILGMRFHANVCGIGLGKETFGLATYPQITQLYEEIGLSERAVDTSRPNFAPKVVDLVKTALTRDFPDPKIGQALADVNILRNDFSELLKLWLTRQGVLVN